MTVRDHLTEPNPELAQRVAQTPPGMAHWSGTGPEATACRGCQFFMGKVRRTGIGVGEMQPGRCRKFVALMKGALCRRSAPVHLIPPDTASCSHFAAKPTPKAAP